MNDLTTQVTMRFVVAFLAGMATMYAAPWVVWLASPISCEELYVARAAWPNNEWFRRAGCANP